jgi:hypothetical protein
MREKEIMRKEGSSFPDCETITTLPLLGLYWYAIMSFTQPALVIITFIIFSY